METEQRIEALQQGIQAVGERLEKINPCHVKSGPTGGQFCETGGGSRGGAKPGGGLSSAGDKKRVTNNAVAARAFARESPKATEKLGSAKIALSSATHLLRGSKPDGTRAAAHLSNARRNVQDVREMASSKGNTGAIAHLSAAHGSLSSAHGQVLAGDFKGALKTLRTTNI